VRLFVRLQKILNSLVGILAMTLIVLAAIVTLSNFSSAARLRLRARLSTHCRSGTSVSAMTLISLIVLPLLHPIVDVVNWQRVAAFARLRDAGQFKDGEWTAAFKTFGVTYALEVPLMALFIVLFGAIAGLTLAGTSEGNATQVFMASLLAQENSVATAIVSLLMLGLLALAVATMGSLFSAALDVVARDIVPALRSQSTSAAGTADGGRARATLIAGLVIGLLVLTTFLLAEMSAEHTFGIAGLLGAMLAFSSAQIALAPLVLAPLFGRLRPFRNRNAAWAFAVLSVGAAIGVGMTIAGLVFGRTAVAVGRACLFRSDHIAVRNRRAGRPAGQCGRLAFERLNLSERYRLGRVFQSTDSFLASSSCGSDMACASSSRRLITSSLTSAYLASDAAMSYHL
jgi:hypothetical protein